MNIAKFYDVIKNNESFLVTSHIVPDGDSIGSTLALTLALLKIGKKAVPVINDKIPKKYLYLPGSDFIKEEIRGKYDVIIALDCGDIGRLGFEKELKEYGNIVVNIDHHKSNTYFGDLNIVDSKASSVGEIVYRLLDGKIEIDYDISINLFTSIITDTGSIRYGNTTSSSLIILAKLIDNGVKPEYVSRQIYENRSLSSIILLKLVLDTLKISSDGKLASLYITNEMMEISGASEEDTEGIINYAREIEGVKVAVLFKENKGPMIKVGLRSNKSIDVSKIAEEFKGGGHENAAGCNVKQPLNKARNIILNKIKEHMMGNLVKGVINVLKPPGMTSHDVVDYLRKLLRFKKIGHGGTLDPSAAGVLPVFVGRATTAIEFFVEDDKEYIAEISFGIVTDTGDFEGNIIKTIPTKIMESELKETLLQFTGEILQIPPMYSAVKYKGKKLYELARRGISVSRKPRKVKIHFIDLLDCNGSTASIKVACSKGTYIRTLCEDIGKELGCGSCLSCLVRTRSGSFTIKNSVTLEEIRKIIATDMLEKILLPTDNYLKSMPTVRLTSSGGIFFTKGRRLYGDFEYLRGHVGKFVKVYNFEDFLGVAIVKKQGTQIILQVFKSLY